MGFGRGISYNYRTPADLALRIEACHKHGIKLQGLYVHSYPDRDPACDPAFIDAIPLLKGTGCVIWLTLRETKDKTRNYDKESAAVVRDIAGHAAANGLQVAIYPHFGFYVATAADSLRIANLVDQPNVGPSLNLCHEFLTGNGGKLDETIQRVAPQAILVSINGMNVAGKYYFGRLDEGGFELAAFVKKVRPVRHIQGLQGLSGLP